MTDALMIHTTEPGDEPPEELRYRHRVSLLSSLRAAWASREILRSLVERQLRARYKQAFLGAAWAIITPIALTVAFTLLFNRVAKIDTEGVPYPLYSYLGLLPWTFFSGSLTNAANSLVTNVSLINKVFCPREVFPLASVTVSGLDTVLATFALAVLFAVNTFAPRVTSVWLVPLVLIALVTTVGWAFLLAIMTVYVRDLRYALPLALQVALFGTPIAYGYDVIPRALRGVYAVLNPIGPVIEGLRDGVLHGRAPDPEYTILAAVGAVVVFLIGYLSFKKLETGIADVA